MPRGGKINRREFLRASALAAAGITLAACGANQATPTTAPGGGPVHPPRVVELVPRRLPVLLEVGPHLGR